MKIQDITNFLESIAPRELQEKYDNSGLLTGAGDWECTGVVTCLDATVEVVTEAIEKKANLVVAHHPIIFGGLKSLDERNYVGRALIKAIKHDIAIYAVHTNLDNVLQGVNSKMADRLGLTGRQILQPKRGALKKLVTFVPSNKAEELRSALFAAGGGRVGNYSECSFNIDGLGSFKPEEGTTPYVGRKGQRHIEAETRIELVFPSWLEPAIFSALIKAHPYEEVAYNFISLDNVHQEVGSGLVGVLPQSLTEAAVLELLKVAFGLKIIRHSPFTGRMVNEIAVCGGAGSFLINPAIASGADFFVTSDLKYHEFFDANGRLVIADIGHYESEQFTIELLFEVLSKKFANFAVQKTGVETNPVQYFVPRDSSR